MDGEVNNRTARIAQGVKRDGQHETDNTRRTYWVEQHETDNTRRTTRDGRIGSNNTRRTQEIDRRDEQYNTSETDETDETDIRRVRGKRRERVNR